MMIKLFNRDKKHIATWQLPVRPMPAVPFSWPNIVVWRGFPGPKDARRYFSLNPASIEPAPTERLPEYFEIDEPVELGDLP